MKILAIETSCDDTCVAIIEIRTISGSKIPLFKVLSNIVSSQTKVHRKYGGVVPALAKREHQKNLVPVLKKALREAKMFEIFNFQFSIFKQFSNSNFQILQKILKREPQLLEQFTKKIALIKKPGIDLIAVTHGPGLEPALWAGVNFARALSYWWNIPLLGVDHMEGHIAANFLEQKISRISNFKFLISNFPAVCLAVSGGHTQLILVKDINKYKLLGETVDDAAGEGFDKVARMLGLGFPGGPEISRLAEKGNSKTFNFARPMMTSGDYNFSFSGLKTSVLYQIKKLLNKKTNEVVKEGDLKKINKKTKADIAASFQQAAVDVLISKTINAAKNYNSKTILLAGGVAANKKLRKQLREKIKSEIPDSKYLIPDTKLSTDNAAMIAAAAYFHRNRATLTRWKTLRADGNLKIK